MNVSRESALDQPGDDGTWYPDTHWREEANWTKFLAREELADYPELMSRLKKDPAWFWNALFNFLDIRFENAPTEIVDLSKGIEWAAWCGGGRLNATMTLLDRHIEQGRGSHEAVRSESEAGVVRSFTYADLARDVNGFAHGLTRLGIGQGDVVAIYMPMVPEAIIAFLAISRLGAIAMPVYSGFGRKALVERLTSAGAVAVIGCEATMRRGRTISMKAVLDEALTELPDVRTVVIVPGDPARRSEAGSMVEGRDHWWPDVIAAENRHFPPVIVPAEHPLMIVYTSGTTGKSKGTIHTHCGFLAKAGEDYLLCFDLKATDRWMWMSDIGWLVGPLQIVSTLLAGATLLLAEGAPDYPERGRLWRLVQDHRLTMLGISPTTARLMQSHGDAEVLKYDLSSLRAIASTGEPWDVASWKWVWRTVLQRRGPLMNNIGGTEVGAILATNVLYPIRPMSFFGPVPGTGADIVDAHGHSVTESEVGELVMREPCIGTTRGLWKERVRYLSSYWHRFPGMWVHGDWASRDHDGFWYVHGRSDDTINVAGKRTGPAEIESVLIATGLLADAAAIEIPDALKGGAIVCVVVARKHRDDYAGDAATLRLAVSEGLGAAFRPKEIVFVSDLPRTRNGKIIRRSIRAVLIGHAAGDLTSLENPEVLDELRSEAVRRISFA